MAEKKSERVARMLTEIGDVKVAKKAQDALYDMMGKNKVYPSGKENQNRKYVRLRHVGATALMLAAISTNDRAETVGETAKAFGYLSGAAMLAKYDGKLVLAESIKYANEKSKEMKKRFVHAFANNKSLKELKTFAVSIMKKAQKKQETPKENKSNPINRDMNRGGR